MRSTNAIAFACLLALIANGCTRTRYRLAADRDSHAVLNEKEACAAWELPLGYSVMPDPRARFFDPTNPDCPQLPIPRPILNGYRLPELASRPSTANNALPAAEYVSPPPPEPLPAVNPSIESDQPTGSPNQPVPEPAPAEPRSLPLVIPIEQPVYPASFVIQPVSEAIDPPQAQESSATLVDPAADIPAPQRPFNGSTIAKVTIPVAAWDVLPANCIARMMEFESMRAERAQSFTNERMESMQPIAQRLTLENLMELAVINSREYQARKELLYRAALAVTRQRYQFELNPTPFGNGSAAIYRHSRDEGETVNSLGVPSTLGFQQTMASGGQFLARFANSVVLTFNGPSGFATDIGSEMVFDFQQTIFQRDVRFENLTQSERDVVYAARDYLRFRKQLFRDIANQYYNLLLSYRGIEINAQDYFTNLRGFLQSQAEYRTAEKIPRIQVDQFEQNVLRTRSNLVTNCFALEAALDQLKFRLGLPPEMSLFLDLTELESISLRDEFSVARQMISRARLELLNAKTLPTLDATSLANVAEVLADRMMNILRVQQRMVAAEAAAANASGPENQASYAMAMEAIERVVRELDQHRQLLQILGARLQVDFLRTELDLQLQEDLPVPPLRVLIRAIDFNLAELQVIDMAIGGLMLNSASAKANALLVERNQLNDKLTSLIAFLEKISTRSTLDLATDIAEGLADIPVRMKESVELVAAFEKLADEATRDVIPADGRSIESKVQSTVDETIELSDRLLMQGPDGWTEINLDSNEAMLTALVQRLDLMNRRGDLADAWRQIKLAGDDLRSIVDLRATQVIRTNSNEDKAFDFTFDDSETRLSLALDTPLNRRVQRNNYRLALINYNVGLRNLMAAEDNIKLDVREDLRQLQLDRNQYTIAIASAALAYERVISTRLRLQLAVQNVAARDFLESQQAYTTSLSAIARQHVNYITDRIELFFDLEAFDVDTLGNWAGAKEDYSPQINVDFPATNPHPYDCLPSRVWYSPTVRQMESIPPGQAIIGNPP